MAETNRPDDSEPRQQPGQATDADSTGEKRTTQPRAEEVEDLPVADEEFSDQVRGGRQRLDQDMDPY